MLELRFASEPGRAEIRCDADRVDALQDLRDRFGSSTGAGARSFYVDVEDLLVNLAELAGWPDRQDVVWQPELLQLVETNAADAATVKAALAEPAPTQDAAPTELGFAWEAPLTDFQRRDLAKLAQLAHGANFSVPGAGKTRVSLALFEARRHAGKAQRLLVVAPKSAFDSWKFEAAECYPSSPLSVAVFEGGRAPAVDLLLVNYERVAGSVAALADWLEAQPAMMVLDEAHRIKLGSAGVWGAACLSLAPVARHRLILSGTPAPNGPQDLESLFSFVWPGQGRATVRGAVEGRPLSDAARELRPLFSRTTKAELGLPPVDVAVRRIALPRLHRELYDALVGHVSTSVRQGEDDVSSLGKVLVYLLMAATTPALLAVGGTKYEPLTFPIPPLDAPAGSSLGTLLRDLPLYELSPKYQEVAAIVAANAQRGEKTLVWSTFVRNLTSLKELLARFCPAVVHGGTEDRDAELRRFKEDDDCFVLLSNPATLGEGVSLHHHCHNAVYVDRDFAAGRFLQSVDRIHRLGLAQDVRTTVTVLAAADTVDDLVEHRLELKLDFMSGVLDDPSLRVLGDLEEEPTDGLGMDASDVAALLGHLSNGRRT